MVEHAAPTGRHAAESESGPIPSESMSALSADAGTAASTFALIAPAVIEVDMTAMKAASTETMITRAFRFDAFTISSFSTRASLPRFTNQTKFLRAMAVPHFPRS